MWEELHKSRNIKIIYLPQLDMTIAFINMIQEKWIIFYIFIKEKMLLIKDLTLKSNKIGKFLK